MLAPYHVPWVISACALLLLALSLCWLVLHDLTLSIMARLSLADGIAFWLTLTALYHTFRTLRAHELAISNEAAALWLLWAGMAAYLALRLIPSPLRRETVMMGGGLVLWAWTIGAGYQYVEATTQRAELLQLNPSAALSTSKPATSKPATSTLSTDAAPSTEENPLDALRGALALERLAAKSKAQVASLILDLTGDVEINVARKAAVRQVLIPEILEHYRRDLSRLRTYQMLQILMLCAVLLAWGFGRKSNS